MRARARPENALGIIANAVARALDSQPGASANRCVPSHVSSSHWFGPRNGAPSWYEA